MKKVFIVIAVAVLCLFAINHFNADPGLNLERLLKKNSNFSGELKYRIYVFGVVPAGEAVIYPAKEEDYQGEAVYHLRAQARVLKIFSRFFNAFAELDSYIDTASLNPRLFRQKIVVSGRPEINKEVFYDQKENTMVLAGVKRQIMPDTHDPLSLMYNFRHMDLEKMKDFDLSLNTNQKNYMVKGTVSPGEVKAGGVVYKTALASADIKRRDKNPYHKTKISVLFLKDKGNIPFMIKVLASGFPINVKLIEAK